MRKKIMIAAAILVMCFAFVSCGKSIGGEMTFELKDNGKCVLNVAGEEESGKWSENEDGFNVEDQFDFKVDGDKATMDYSGVTITLEKQ